MPPYDIEVGPASDRSWLAALALALASWLVLAIIILAIREAIL